MTTPIHEAATTAAAAAAASSAWSWTSIVSFIAGAGVAIFAEPIRKWILRPALEVTFDPATCVLKTPTLISVPFVDLQTGANRSTSYESSGRYLRVRVGAAKRTARRLVKGCRPYLINVELEKHGKFGPSIFADTLQLRWASQPDDISAKPIDIPGDVSQFVEVISAGKKDSNYSLHAVVPMPFYCHSLFDDTAKRLRFTILITSDDAKSQRIRIVFEWKGKWDTFDAYQD